MALKLMQITNDPTFAIECERYGVDFVFVDLETMGKVQRQGHLNTVISHHAIEDVRAVGKALTSPRLLVRVNPIHQRSAAEIDAVIEAGANRLMLPFFHTVDEVDQFVRLVAGRAETTLLVETPEAVASASEIASTPGIDSVHVGLNDLHLALELDFMFEPLVNGLLDSLFEILRSADVPFGIGGIARLGAGRIPAEILIAEHYRVGSTSAILSRQFLDTLPTKSYEAYAEEIARIRHFESFLAKQPPDYFDTNRHTLERLVSDAAETLRHNRLAPSRQAR